MESTFSPHFFQIEIPELENREIIHKNIFFNIIGLESERPLIRINNHFYQGKWVSGKNFIILPSKNTKVPELTIKSRYFFFPKNTKKTKIKKISINKDRITQCPTSEYIIIGKKLRLYRIPLVVSSFEEK